MEWTFSLEEIGRVAAAFWEAAGASRVIAFHGSLGAGKTTFIKALCKEKGVKEVMSSPTFSLINDYVYTDETGREQHIFHLDVYRIGDEDEAVRAGIEDCLYSGALCMVEWAEKIPGLLPEGTLHATLLPAEAGRRLLLE